MEAKAPAEELLIELGIDEPSQIDIEAIAYCQGVDVIYRQLTSCEAKIVGNNDKAVAVINSSSNAARRRFSIAHELGHWYFHRGRNLDCRTHGEISTGEQKSHFEIAADKFAADLLMPKYLFSRYAAASRWISVDLAVSLSDEFQTSLTATAIRLAQIGPEPIVIVAHSQHGREWHWKNEEVPGYWYPNSELHPESGLMDIVFGGKNRSNRQIVDTDDWFSHRSAGQSMIYEEGIRIYNGWALAILTFKDGVVPE